MNIFPWSNFHDLNLDWLLQQVKQLREDVDALAGGASPSSSIPLMDGTGSAGSSVSYSRGDHRHPTDTSRASQSDLTAETTARTNKDLSLDADIAAVDAKISFSAATPEMDGVASVGVSTSQARADHRHPTDTSRASQSDLTAETTARTNKDLALDSDIAAVDAKIKFLATNPNMDGTASPGFSDYLTRADHVHPTDTSRASQADLTALSLRVDGISGAANPYTSIPEMDGTASAGSIDEYSRGDHVHPHDSSKFDKSGGTVNGPLNVANSFWPKMNMQWYTFNSTGWKRIVNLHSAYGTAFKLCIATSPGPGEDAEYHECIIFLAAATKAYIINEVSKTPGSPSIERVRITNDVYVDIYNGSGNSIDVGVSILPVTSGAQMYYNSIEVLDPHQDVTTATTLTSLDFGSSVAPTYKTLKYVDDSADRNITIGSNNYSNQSYGITGLNGTKVVAISLVTWTNNSGAISFMPYGSATYFYAFGASGTTMNGARLRFWYYD